MHRTCSRFLKGSGPILVSLGTASNNTLECNCKCKKYASESHLFIRDIRRTLTWKKASSYLKTLSKWLLRDEPLFLERVEGGLGNVG